MFIDFGERGKGKRNIDVGDKHQSVELLTGSQMGIEPTT